MKFTVIGGGPGGYTAAFAAADRGCEVTLIEKDALGGTCLNRGCIPTKTLRSTADALVLAKRMAEYGISLSGEAAPDLDGIRKRKQSVVKILVDGLEKTAKAKNVTVVKGSARVLGANRVIAATAEGDVEVTGDAVIIATGSGILQIPGLTFDHKVILSSDDALELQSIPERLVIVGGGVIGCELACIYRAFGSQVIIVEGQDRLLPLPSVDKDVSALLAREMKKLKIKIQTGRTLRDVTVEGCVAKGTIAASPFIQNPTPAQQKEEAVEADMVLVTVGRVPNTAGLGLEAMGIAVDRCGWIAVNENLETSVPGIYAIGDVLGPAHVMLAHVASMEALTVVDTLLGSPKAMDYSVVPSAIFTAPEIGAVGLSESQAAKKGEIVTGTVQMRELGKAQAMGELPGFFKIIADRATGKLLGVHIGGAHASDLVAEAALAIQNGCTARKLAQTIHAHPTLAEGLFEAARVTEANRVK